MRESDQESNSRKALEAKIREFVDKIPMTKGIGVILVSDWYPIKDDEAIPILEKLENVQVWNRWMRKFKIFN